MRVRTNVERQRDLSSRTKTKHSPGMSALQLESGVRRFRNHFVNLLALRLVNDPTAYLPHTKCFSAKTEALVALILHPYPNWSTQRLVKCVHD